MSSLTRPRQQQKSISFPLPRAISSSPFRSHEPPSPALGDDEDEESDNPPFADDDGNDSSEESYVSNEEYEWIDGKTLIEGVGSLLDESK